MKRTVFSVFVALAFVSPVFSQPTRVNVTQKGSLVAPDYFRFDFSHPKPLSREDVAAIEEEVNRHIRDNEPVGTRLMSPDDAVAAGALALFGEKYGDEVRVLSMGRNEDANYSVELCGGTHVRALGDIHPYLGEDATTSGVVGEAGISPAQAEVELALGSFEVPAPPTANAALHTSLALLRAVGEADQRRWRRLRRRR